MTPEKMLEGFLAGEAIAAKLFELIGPLIDFGPPGTFDPLAESRFRAHLDTQFGETPPRIFHEGP